MAGKEKLEKYEQQDKKARIELMKKRRATTHNFYFVTYSKGRLNIEIDLLQLTRKLKELGFFRYDLPNGSGSQTVYIKDNKISVVDKVKVIDLFEDYVNSIGECDWEVVTGRDSDGGELWSTETVYPDMIIAKLYKNQDFYFGTILDRLRPKEPIKILTDDKYHKYLFFRNCVVVVSDVGLAKYKDINKLSENIDEIKKLPEEEQRKTIGDYIKNKEILNSSSIFHTMEYSAITDGYIWETSIVDRDFKYRYNSEKPGDFEIFAQLISGVARLTPNMYFPQEYPKVIGLPEERVYSLMSLIGYLMHDFYDCNELAVIFTDVNKDGLKAAGGTGKGLLGKALDHLLNRNFRSDKKVLTIPGKDFDASKDTRYASGDISTQLIHIEDLRSDFKLDGLYNDIADGATFRPLFHNPMYKKCKFMLSMNQALKIETEGSDGRRVVVFELENFFGVNRRPEDYFGALNKKDKKRFWSDTDWSDDDWNDFFSFMVRCVSVYLNYGIIKPKDINFSERAAKSAVGSEDAWAYFETVFQGAIINPTESLKWSKSDLWNTFNSRYFGTYKTQKSFSEKMMVYLNCKHIRTALYRDGVRDWIWLNPTKEELESHSMELKIK